MSFLSALKAVGKGIAKVLPIVGQAAPVVLSAAGVPAGASVVVGSLIQRAQAVVGLVERTAATVEAQGGKMDGKAKLALGVSLANDSISVAEVVSGRNIVDNDKFARGTAKFQAAVAQLVEAVADIEDSVEHKA